MKTRLCLVPGTWQFITLAASLSQFRRDHPHLGPTRDVAIVFENMGALSLMEWMERLGRGVWDWSAIHRSGELLNPKLHPDTWPWPMDDIARRVKEAWQLDRVDEIWISHVDTTEARVAMEIYPRANVILYEDGICAPTRIWRKQWSHWRHLLASLPGLIRRRKLPAFLASERVVVNSTPLHYFRRTSEMYSFINQAGDVPPPFDTLRFIMIERERICDAMDAAYRCLDLDQYVRAEAPPGSHEVLLLAQPIARMMLLHHEGMDRNKIESDYYIGVVGELVAKGYSIRWKDHPRQEVSIVQEMIRRFPGRVRQSAIPPQVPIEIVAGKLGFRICISINSSSLYYLPVLHGIQSYTTADRLIPLMTPALVRALTLDSAADRFPSTKVLPPVTLSPLHPKETAYA